MKAHFSSRYGEDREVPSTKLKALTDLLSPIMICSLLLFHETQ